MYTINNLTGNTWRPFPYPRGGEGNSNYSIGVNGSLKELEDMFKRGVDPNSLFLNDSKNDHAFNSLLGRNVNVFDRIEMFVRYGMNVNFKSGSGWTPLFTLCTLGVYDPLEQRSDEETRRDFRQIAEFLVKNGADPNIPNNGNDTCLHSCTKHNPFFFYLIEHLGGNRFIKNNRGRTPLDLTEFGSWQSYGSKYKMSEVKSLEEYTMISIVVFGIDISNLPKVFAQNVPKW